MAVPNALDGFGVTWLSAHGRDGNGGVLVGREILEGCCYILVWICVCSFVFFWGGVCVKIGA